MRTSTLPAVDPWRSPAAYAVFARADTVRSESLAGTPVASPAVSDVSQDHYLRVCPRPRGTRRRRTAPTAKGGTAQGRSEFSS